MVGILIFIVDYVLFYLINNIIFDNYIIGSIIGCYIVDVLGGKGNIVVFNVFFNLLCICGICYDLWKYVL